MNMFSLNDPIIDAFVMPKTIKLPSGESSIIVDERNTTTYTASNCSSFKPEFANSPLNWHMVLIPRKNFSKQDILEGLHKAVDNELFVPIAYHEGQDVDYFVVCNQAHAIRKLFASGLLITVQGTELQLVIKLVIGAVTLNSFPKIHEKVIASINEQINSASLFGGSDVLDLEDLGKNKVFKGIDISLRNKACLNLLCDQLNGIEKLKAEFLIFKLAGNEIQSLDPFRKLYNFHITKLDLRHNQINYIADFRNIAHLEIEELFLSGNDCTKVTDYREKIFSIVPYLKRIDGMVRLSKVSSEPSSSVFSLLPSALSTPLDVKPKNTKIFNSSNGTGNDLILNFQTGVTISGDKISNRNEFARLRDSFKSYRINHMWTQVTVQHSDQFTKEELFDEIVPRFFNNCHFFPCYYKRYPKRDEFFLYKNFDALNNLMVKNLMFEMPPRKIYFTLCLNVAEFVDGQVDWFPKINHVLTKRIRNNVLDLNNFVSDPEFAKVIIPMNSKNTVHLILEQARRQNNNIERINAQGNGITTLEGFSSLPLFSKLVAVDLRNNKIGDLTAMSVTTRIKELFLDGNPICERFDVPQKYVAEVRQRFTELDWLDGHRLDDITNIVALQNFIVARDAYTLAEEFVKTFFTIYDSFERQQLMQMYTDKSMFTLSIHFEPDRTREFLSTISRIKKYADLSRNIIKTSDLSQLLRNVVVGVSGISSLFGELPKTSHKFASFSIDVPMYNQSGMCVITVSGIFNESGKNLNDKEFTIGFVRTFVLHSTANHEIKIFNEQLFIHNTSRVAPIENRGLIKQNYINHNCGDLMPTLTEDKQMKLILYQELTKLKKEEAIKHLDGCNWDVKVTLASFNTWMDSHEISDNFFDFK